MEAGVEKSGWRKGALQGKNRRPRNMIGLIKRLRSACAAAQADDKADRSPSPVLGRVPRKEGFLLHPAKERENDQVK